MRTQQDNDISLYSLDELRAMQNRYKGNYKGWQPFTAKEVNAEIIQREMTPELINTAKKWLSGGYSEAYIQSQMYAARNESTSIFHIAAAIEKAKQS
jgi:hypothetical protein